MIAKALTIVVVLVIAWLSFTSCLMRSLDPSCDPDTDTCTTTIELEPELRSSSAGPALSFEELEHFAREQS